MQRAPSTPGAPALRARAPRRRASASPTSALVEEDLPVQVRALDHVVVAEPERADARARERERRRAPEAADADQQDACARARRRRHRAASAKYSSRLK